MNFSKKISGSLTAIVFVVISTLLLVYPEIQISSIAHSESILNFVENYIVNQGVENECENELFWVKFIYIFFSLILFLIYFIIHYKKNLDYSYLIILLIIQFYILQTPFFIFYVDRYYNCFVDGQTGMAIFISSFTVSLFLILPGIIHDYISYYKRKQKREAV